MDIRIVIVLILMMILSLIPIFEKLAQERFSDRIAPVLAFGKYAARFTGFVEGGEYLFLPLKES